MCMRSLKRAFRAAAIAAAFAASSIAVPASAEHWQLLDHKTGRHGSVDLDSLHWEGATVSYRFGFEGRPNSNVERLVNTSVINCGTHQRKWIASERHLSDGTVREAPVVALGWRTIPPGGLMDAVQQVVYAKRP